MPGGFSDEEKREIWENFATLNTKMDNLTNLCKKEFEDNDEAHKDYETRISAVEQIKAIFGFIGAGLIVISTFIAAIINKYS